MGSLIYLGQDLQDTPYFDLSLKDTLGAGSNTASERQLETTGGVCLPVLPLVTLCTDQEGEVKGVTAEQAKATPTEEAARAEAMDVDEEGDGAAGAFPQQVPPDMFVRAAHLFGTAACRRLALSSIDPLRIALVSGLRVLPKMHKLKLAFAWLNNYTPGNSDGTQTLPVRSFAATFVSFN